MRRIPLRPARPVSRDGAFVLEVPWPEGLGASAGARGPDRESPGRGRLEAPRPARERRRPLFHPRRGWFRRLERQLSYRLGASVFPRVPGMALPYSAQLDRGLTLADGEIALPGLPSAFDGLRLLLITDVHTGPFLSAEALARAFRRLLRVEPDLILIGGDLTTSRLADYEAQAGCFRLLDAPLGVLAVLGNHDHYGGQAEALRERVETAGIRVLHNGSIALERGGARLSVAGVDDLLVGRPDLDAALAGTDGPVVLLSHNPDLLFEAARRGVALMLSGHTHGGQVRLPGLGVLVRQSRYRLDEGRFTFGPTQLVVSRGLGAVGLPLRLGCPPEAVLLRLRRAG